MRVSSSCTWHVVVGDTWLYVTRDIMWHVALCEKCLYVTRGCRWHVTLYDIACMWHVAVCDTWLFWCTKLHFWKNVKIHFQNFSSLNAPSVAAVWLSAADCYRVANASLCGQWTVSGAVWRRRITGNFGTERTTFLSSATFINPHNHILQSIQPHSPIHTATITKPQTSHLLL
jgi:hypothetical protein